MLKKILSVCLLATCLTGCSFKPSLISEKKVISEIQENIPNATHIETIHESHPQTPDEETGMNIYLFTTDTFDFHVYNYLSHHFGTKNPQNQVYIEYDAALLTYLEPQIKTILSDCGFTYQFDHRTGHDKLDNYAVLIVNNTFTSDSPYLHFYTDNKHIDEELLLRVQDAVAQIAALLEPYIIDSINLHDVISFPVSIQTTKPDSLNATLFHSNIDLSEKRFEKDIKIWSELTVKKANR